MRGSSLIACALLGCGGCESEPTQTATASALTAPALDDGATSVRDEPLQPLPAAPRVDPKRAAIGGKLFASKRLSADGTVACDTCHPLDRAGADGLMHSRGANGVEMVVNTPTVYNVSFNARFNWDGAYATLEDEFDAPVTKTMGTSWQDIEGKLRADPELSAAFVAAYPDGVTTANVRDALARYIDTLLTPSSRFDQYLRGDRDALSFEELRGYETFKSLGCASCHQGANVGGNLFQRLGVMHDYFKERARRGGAEASAADLGRFEQTKRPMDRFVFRVPSLRNVALTAPYFHDGSVPTLEHAVAIMGYVQLGRRLTVEQIAQLVAFLHTLTGLPSASRPEGGPP